ncbi:hypothetical protein [Streptomyces sp. AC555_RSS877]|uniref:hypothetical protein n=1 Tax=Streptomyces sp. AC555_RSS877 TaxID=2823688 RepID=UPI0035AC13B0
MLILTSFDLDEYAFAGLNAGASGCLPKNTRPQPVKSHLGGSCKKLELRDRIQAVVFAYESRLIHPA